MLLNVGPDRIIIIYRRNLFEMRSERLAEYPISIQSRAFSRDVGTRGINALRCRSTDKTIRPVQIRHST